MTAAIYWLIALGAYCFFTYQAVLTGGIERAVGTKNGGLDDMVAPWFLVWILLGATWPGSLPAWFVIRVAMNKRKELKDD